MGSGGRLPASEDELQLANDFANFFEDKILEIRKGFPPPREGEVKLPEQSLSSFRAIALEELRKIILSRPSKSCALDPIPTALLKHPLILEAALPLLVKCVNESIESGNVPDCLKTSLVTPLLKKSSLDRDVLRNYRPVSNLPFISKVIEKVIAQQLVHFLNSNGLVDPLQSAYRVGHSTETALLKIKGDIDRALDSGQGVILILLDMSAAFDTIDHGVLLSRLRGLGVNGMALDWCQSYLTLRTQAVVIDGNKSAPKPLTCGVPQGSVLGPLLFSLYIQPLGAIIDQHSKMRHGFADDIQLYATFEPTVPGLLAAIFKAEDCVRDVREWLAPNHLQCNDGKTEFLVIASKYRMSRLQPLPTIQIGAASVRASSQVRNLGAQFDAHLSMSPQVSSVVKSVYFQISRLAKVRRYLTDATCARIINALITTRLDFQNSLLLGLPDCEISRLQRAQNSAARLLTGTRRREHITPILKTLHWLPVRQRIDYKILLTVHNVLHRETSPGYLQEFLRLRSSARGLRSSADPWLLAIPMTKTQYGDRSLGVMAPRLWNSLPAEMRCHTDTNTFKKTLKTYLFRNIFD